MSVIVYALREFSSIKAIIRADDNSKNFKILSKKERRMCQSLGGGVGKGVPYKHPQTKIRGAER